VDGYRGLKSWSSKKTPNCQECEDSGWRLDELVVTDEAVAKGYRLVPLAVPCQCEAGRSRLAWMEGQK